MKRVNSCLIALSALCAAACVTPANARRAFLSSCVSSSDCQSNLCFKGTCTTTCTATEQCGAQAECVEEHCAKIPGDCTATNACDASGSGDTVGASDIPVQKDSGLGSAKRVFTTSQLFTANLGGLVGADAKCQAAADKAKLGGTFKAWLSDSKQAPANRFDASCFKGAPFVLIDGTVIAKDWAELTSGTLQAGISKTETGAGAPLNNACPGLPPGTAAWTLTTEGGAAEADKVAKACVDWTSGSMATSAQMVWGKPGATKNWSINYGCNNFGATSCSRTASLYCFEQ